MLFGCGGTRYRPIEPAFDRLPEPLSIRDLVEAEDRFGRLDPARWAPIEAIHAEHLDAYAAWRRRSLESLRATMRGRSWKEVEQDPEALARLERRARANLAALEALEEGFLSALREALAGTAWDGSAPGASFDAIAFLRTRRALARWLAIIESGGGRPRDLRAWIDRQRWLDRFGEAAAEIEASIERSERSSAAILERLAIAEWSLPRRAAELAAAATDRLPQASREAPSDDAAESGTDTAGPDVLGDPQSDPEPSSDPEAIVAEARAPVAQALQELLALQERTIREIASRLPDPAGLVLESAFLAELLGGDVRGAVSGPGPREATIAMALARELDGDDQNPPDGSALVAGLLALRGESRSVLSPQEQARLGDEARRFLERRLALLRRLLEQRRAASRPGTLAGGARSDDRRGEASREVLDALAALGGDMAAWLAQEFDRARLAELLRREWSDWPVELVVPLPEGDARVEREVDRLAEAGAGRSRGRGLLGRFDRPIEAPALETGPRGLPDEDGAAWIAGRVCSICGLDDADSSLLVQVFEADRERRGRILEEGEARIERRARTAIEALQAIGARFEDLTAEDGSPDPASIEAARDVVARHASPIAADFERMILEMEACHLGTIEGLRAALPLECIERCVPLLRLAVAEGLWQSIAGDRPARGEVATGFGLSIARMALALPLEPEEFAVCGGLAAERTAGIRAALVGEHGAAIAAAISMLEREMKLASPSSPGKPGPEVARLLAARRSSLLAQWDFLQSIESAWPEAAAVLRETAMSLRWEGMWDDTAAIAESAADLVLTDSSLAAWAGWRATCVEALTPELFAKPAAAPSAIGRGVDWSDSIGELLRSDPDLHAAMAARREGLFRAARRIAADGEASDPRRALALRAMVIAHPVGDLDGDRIWE